MIYKESLLIYLFITISLSYSFHVLWLLYDMFAVISFYYFIRHTNTQFLIVIFISFLYFADVLLLQNNTFLISFLSLWDNLKHIFIIFMLLDLIQKYYSHKRIKIFSNRLGVYFHFLFFLEFFFILWQNHNGVFMDDIAGTFGYGGSHSIGYLCLLYIIYLLYIANINFLFISVILILSTIMNIYSENMGFFALLLYIFIPKNKKLIYFILFFILLFISLNFDIEFLFNLLSRYRNIFNFEMSNYYLVENTTSRGLLVIYALYLGDLWGSGFGVYSDIYGLQGSEIESLLNSQINISSLTNLLAEYGIIGTIIVLILYIYVINYFFKTIGEKVFVSTFFILLIYYNRVLIDERLSLMFILMLVFFKIYFEFRNKEKNVLHNNSRI